MTLTPQTDNVTSQVAAPRKSRKRKLAELLLGTVAIVGMGWFLLQGSASPPAESTRSIVARNGEVGDAFPALPPPPPPANPVAATPPSPPPPGRLPGMPNLLPAMPRQVVRPPISALQTTGGLRHGADAEATTAAGTVQGTVPSQRGVESISAMTGGGIGGGGNDRLDAGLGAGRDGGTVAATMLPDRHLFMTMGTPIPCIMEQPVDTQVPGPFRCKVTGPVYGTSGAVPLLDSGTWAFGRIAQHLERGMDRAFAVITRLETPQGCLVKLRASVGDQLGTPGIDGEVDTHFWERFRGIAMIALLDAAGQAAALAAANAIGDDSGVTFNQFQSGSRTLAQGSFGDDVNIPPTLKRGQANQVLIMAVDDIDMRSCFQLTMAK